MAKSAKGSSYERGLAKELSKWWMKDESQDDVFWRTHGSGGRAKSRGRAGRRTDGQHGDLAATDNRGHLLTELICFELKRGYSKHTFQDLIDRSDKSALQEYEKWIQQSLESLSLSDCYTWAVVTKRNQRLPIIVLEWDFYCTLLEWNCFSSPPGAIVQLSLPVRDDTKIERNMELAIFQLRHWFGHAKPKAIKRLAKEVLRCQKKKKRN